MLRADESALGFRQVGAQAGVAPSGRLRLGGFQQLVVGGEVGAAGGGVPEVIADGPAADIQAAGAGIHEADGQFGILPAPAGERFVVAVDLDEVVAPDGEVAAAYAAQVRTVAAGGPGPAVGVFEAAKLAAKERAATVGGEFAQAKERRPGLLNQRTVALHERTRPRQPQVIGNKGGVGNGVAVEEHEVGAGGPGDGEVKDARAAEAGVLLPNPGAREGLLGSPGFKGGAGLVVGAVVGKHDFLRQLSLAAKAVEEPKKVVGLVEGVDHKSQRRRGAHGADLRLASRTLA